jgi:NhaP-type Na+/H+ or K+/H+ antiporter
MSIISPPGAPPASTNAIGAAARSQGSVGRALSRAVVILIGIAVGCFIGIFIGLLTGWIGIPC